MGDVHVPADYHRLLRVKPYEIIPERVLPAHAVVDALQAVLRVRCVNADKVEVIVFQRDDAPLGVMLRQAEIIADGERRVLCEYRGAGIALALGVAPIALIAGEVKLDLSCLKLCLLKAEKVCVEAPENVLKTFFSARRAGR